MIPNTVSINTLDPRSTVGLQRAMKGENSDEALRAASKQVESMFLHMMLKSMRSASLADGPFDSEQTKLVQDLHDQQLASDLAHSKGIGLADALFRQLGGGRSSPPPALPDTAAKTVPAAKTIVTPESAAKAAALPERIEAAVKAAGRMAASVPQHVRDFVGSILPYARAASLATGIPAHFMVAQAALETGWGTKQPKNADGTPSYNLFNIKAGAGWDGRTTAQHTVSEFESGSWQSQKTAFRSYGSYAEAFADYAKLLSNSPRYADLIGKQDAAGFAQGLQKAGYATDPQYADKLMRLIGGSTLKNALVTEA